MRIAKYFGKTIRFPDDDWKVLVDRLDPKDIVLMEEIKYTVMFGIYKECSLCKKYKTYSRIGVSASCNQCPFAIFGKKIGCIKFLHLLKPSFSPIIAWNWDGISWYATDDKEARRILRDLRKHLFRMEEI